ncbi:MAG: SDR family oxidoreductase [Armatimonadetes bacterium]|nr:MAG: SDR family oxidoreductase [Armatimonadota bacterium]
MEEESLGPNGWTPDRCRPLDDKTFVITGATSGTGLEAARILLRKGARVVMLNRNAEKSAIVVDNLKKELGASVDVTSIEMDLARLASVRNAAAELLERAPRIDALICNAAIAQVPKRELTADGFESQFGVNHLGHFLLCGLLFERIAASEGRIVVVGSLAYKMGAKRIRFEDIHFSRDYSPWHAYNQSKLAQLMFAFELQRRVQASGKNVGVFACHPGASRTNLQSSFGMRDRILWGVLKWLIAQPAERGAWPAVMCATEEGLAPLALYGPTGRGEMVGPVGASQVDECALDRESAAKLWSLSEQLTRLSWGP